MSNKKFIDLDPDKNGNTIKVKLREGENRFVDLKPEKTGNSIKIKKVDE